MDLTIVLNLANAKPRSSLSDANQREVPVSVDIAFVTLLSLVLLFLPLLGEPPRWDHQFLANDSVH